jgi:phosphoribosylanthranilate isomerase
VAGVVTRSDPPRVKICCIASVAEARLAARHGAAAIGLVSAMPSGPGVIPEPLIAEIASAAPRGVESFLLTSLLTAPTIVAQHRRLRTTAVQICDRLPAGAHAAIRAALPGVALVQVVHVADGGALAEAIAVAPEVDAILLDSGDRSGAVARLGGTGRTHDWTISRRIREAVAVPVYLAGGLRPGNVAEAIAAVAPFGVDVCTGVRSDGRLDEAKLAAFMAAARGTATGRGAPEVSP